MGPVQGTETRSIPRAGRKWSESEATQNAVRSAPLTAPSAHPPPLPTCLARGCRLINTIHSCTLFPPGLALAPSLPFCSEPASSPSGETSPASDPAPLRSVRAWGRSLLISGPQFSKSCLIDFSRILPPLFLDTSLGSILPEPWGAPWGPHS